MNSEASPSTGFYDFLAWAEVNKTRLLIGFIILALIGFGIYAMTLRKEQTELTASTALVELRPTPVAGATAPVSPPPSAFQKVISDYPGTAAAERAQLLVAGAFFTEGNYAEAQTHFARFLEGNAGHPFAPIAAYGIGASLEAQNKLDEAVTAYQRVLTQYPQSALVDDSKFSLARVYEAKNQPEAALKLYDELAKSSAEATIRKENLLKTHPELASKAAVPASTNLVPNVSGAPPVPPAN